MRTGDIDRTGDVWTYRPSAHKTAHHGKTREVFIGPKGQEHLRPFLRAKPAAFIFDPREAEAERSEKRREERKSPLTPSQVKRDRRTDPATNKGERYTVGSYRRAIARACDKAFPLPADIELDKVADWRRAHRWHPHQLRHNAATHLRKLHGIEAARVILGHESAETTHIYAEQDLQKAREIMGKVG
jgi:integrase